MFLPFEILVCYGIYFLAYSFFIYTKYCFLPYPVRISLIYTSVVFVKFKIINLTTSSGTFRENICQALPLWIHLFCLKLAYSCSSSWFTCLGQFKCWLQFILLCRQQSSIIFSFCLCFIFTELLLSVMALAYRNSYFKPKGSRCSLHQFMRPCFQFLFYFFWCLWPYRIWEQCNGVFLFCSG